MRRRRGPDPSDDGPPRVRLRYADGQRAVVENVEYGIEEERVPWDAEPGGEPDPVATAYDAAVDSSLEIGVGVAADGSIALHHEQLPEDDPLFEVDDPTRRQAKRIGTNAARLAKRLPFKPVE